MSSSTTIQIAIHSILMATDFTEASFKPARYATTLARRYGSKLYLAHIVDHAGKAHGGSHPIDEATLIALQEGERLESRLAKERSLADVDHALIVRAGDVWDELSQIISTEVIDLVVVGTHGRTGIKKLVLGSVAERIFRNSPCPVLTIGPHVRTPRDPGAEPTHILVPTDFSLQSRLALQYALFIARKHQAQLTLVHILEKAFSNAKEAPAAARSARARLRDFAAAEEILTSGPELVTGVGPMVDRILNIARKRRADLIVIGVSAAAGLKDHALWPNAYRIVCGAHCPVLTVRGGQQL
jgi:nucleotide-binding universal stress UspA family protein